jgi:transcriptional regulator with XRE-family HTH domain
MRGKALKDARLNKKWTQAQTALALGVTQPYLSMMEKGLRPMSESFVLKAHRVLNLPLTELPLPLDQAAWPASMTLDFSAELGALGYPGFSYLRAKARRNPAQVLLQALNQPNLDARVAESLPWLALTYFDMDWDWLVRGARVLDRQNRLGFALSLASGVVERKNAGGQAGRLLQILETLERARLVREDTFCCDSMTQAERVWLRQHRSRLAAHWNLLTDMKGEHLADAFR